MNDAAGTGLRLAGGLRPQRSPRSARTGRIIFGLLSLAIIAAGLPSLLHVLIETPNANGYLGIDYALYMGAARHWLASGELYPAAQLAGPYPVDFGAILYPPVTLWLFVPFTVLPAVLWWATPLAVTVWVVWRHRPSHLAWPLLTMPLAWQPAQIHVISGNPVMWAMAAVALGTIYPWASPFAFVKPSLAIFGLIRLNRRAWWIGAATLALVSLPLLPLWFDWVRVMLNARGSGGLFYSWQEAPMMLLPIVAWIGGRHGPLTGRSSAP